MISGIDAREVSLLCQLVSTGPFVIGNAPFLRARSHACNVLEKSFVFAAIPIRPKLFSAATNESPVIFQFYNSTLTGELTDKMRGCH